MEERDRRQLLLNIRIRFIRYRVRASQSYSVAQTVSI